HHEQQVHSHPELGVALQAKSAHPAYLAARPHTSRRSVCSTEFMVVCSRPGVSREYLFSLFTNPSFASIYGTLVTGTTGSHQRIRPESVLEMTIVIPKDALIEAFTDLAKPMFDRINRNIEQSGTLAALRDTLLP